MFVDSTNLFYSHINIKDLFYAINVEYKKKVNISKPINYQFTLRKLNLNYFFKHEIPLKLHVLMIQNNTAERKYSINFFWE